MATSNSLPSWAVVSRAIAAIAVVVYAAIHVVGLSVALIQQLRGRSFDQPQWIYLAFHACLIAAGVGAVAWLLGEMVRGYHET